MYSKVAALFYHVLSENSFMESCYIAVSLTNPLILSKYEKDMVRELIYRGIIPAGYAVLQCA